MNELEDMSGFYQKMKNVETYQYFSSSRYIVSHKTPVHTVVLTLIKEAQNVIMQWMISRKLFKTVKVDIKVWLTVHGKKCKRGSRRTSNFKDWLCNLPYRKGGSTHSLLFWRLKVVVQSIS